MKETTLINSLRWLMDKGEIIRTKEELREYIRFYNEIKKGLQEYSSVNENYRAIYNCMPEIKYKEFNNPYYLVKTFIFEHMNISWKTLRGLTMEELFPAYDPYPARTKYFNEISNQTRKTGADIRRELDKIASSGIIKKY